MKREAVSILCFLVLLFSMTVPVHGEDLSSVTATVNSDKLVTVSGRIDGGPGQPVNILVRDPNGSLEYMNTCLSGAGGIFNISYIMTNTLAGRYNVTIGAAGAANVAATYFLYGKNSIEATAVLEDGLVKITGTTGAGAGQLITARITAPDSTVEYAGCAMSIADGGFQLSYTLTNTKTGKYTVYLSASGIEEPVVCYFLAGVKTEVKAKIDKQKLVTVEGVAALPGKPVSVQITDPKGKTEYLAGVLTKNDGTFAVSYTMVNETKGYYTVSVSTKGLDTPVKTEFLYGSGLTDLKLSNCSLDPVFNAETLSYSAIVNEDIASLQVTPTAIDSKAVVSINGSIVTSGAASGVIPLNIGENRITVSVTETDKSETTYVVSVTRKETEPSLKGLTISNVTLNPSFSADIINYTATAANSISSVTVTPTAAGSNMIIKVNNTVVKSGTASGAITLETGTNTIIILVESPSKAQRIYEVTITRDTPSYTPIYYEPPRLSNNANLSGLLLNNAVLAPLFSSENLDYTANVSNAIASVTVTPQTADGNAAVKVNNIPVVSGNPSYPISLNPGSNIISVVVTAENGSTRTYTINVIRAVPDNAGLLDLAVSTQHALSPAPFDPDRLSPNSYTVSVPNNIVSLRVIATPVNLDDTVEVIAGNMEDDGSINLAVGMNNIGIKVTSATDGSVKLYLLIVTRQELSNDATLREILVSNGLTPIDFTPEFDKDTISYSATVEPSVSEITIIAEPSHPNADVTINGGRVIRVTLSEGENTITILVTAEDDSTTKTYMLTVTRQSP